MNTQPVDIERAVNTVYLTNYIRDTYGTPTDWARDEMCHDMQVRRNLEQSKYDIWWVVLDLYENEFKRRV